MSKVTTLLEIARGTATPENLPSEPTDFQVLMAFDLMTSGLEGTPAEELGYDEPEPQVLFVGLSLVQMLELYIYLMIEESKDRETAQNTRFQANFKAAREALNGRLVESVVQGRNL